MPAGSWPAAMALMQRPGSTSRTVKRPRASLVATAMWSSYTARRLMVMVASASGEPASSTSVPVTSTPRGSVRSRSCAPPGATSSRASPPRSPWTISGPGNQSRAVAYPASSVRTQRWCSHALVRRGDSKLTITPGAGVPSCQRTRTRTVAGPVGTCGCGAKTSVRDEFSAVASAELGESVSARCSTSAASPSGSAGAWLASKTHHATSARPMQLVATTVSCRILRGWTTTGSVCPAWRSTLSRTAARLRPGVSQPSAAAAKPAGRARRRISRPRWSCAFTVPAGRLSACAIAFGVRPWTKLRVTTSR